MLRAAVEQFIDKDYKDIEAIATETLEGHQRAMMGNMTVDQIFKDRNIKAKVTQPLLQVSHHPSHYQKTSLLSNPN